MEMDKQQIKDLALGVGAIAAGLLVKKVLEEGYKSTFHKDPPNAIKDEEINWLHVVGWSVVTGVSATLLKAGIKRLGAKHISGIG